MTFAPSKTSSLVEQMQDDLYDGLADPVREGGAIFLERGWAPYRILTEALVEGMRFVGDDFRDGILFMPEVLLAANAMKARMVLLRPLLAETGALTLGRRVIGTVKGKIHDIGKNLLSMMMEGAGFEVIDLGINTSVESYLSALEAHEGGDRRDEGQRDPGPLPGTGGGVLLNEEFAQAIGADGYCRDAAAA